MRGDIFFRKIFLKMEEMMDLREQEKIVDKKAHESVFEYWVGEES